MSGTNENPVNGDADSAPKTWVKFEDEKGLQTETDEHTGTKIDEKPAVIEPTVEICSPSSKKNSNNNNTVNNTACLSSSPSNKTFTKSNLNDIGSSTNQGTSGFQNVELQGSNLSLNSADDGSRSNANRVGNRKTNTSGFSMS